MQSPEATLVVRTVLRACLPDGLHQASNLRVIFHLPATPDGQTFEFVDLYVEVLLSMPSVFAFS